MATSSAVVPGTLQGVKGILITIAVIGGGYLIYRNMKKNQELNQANQQGTAAAQELAALAAQGITPSMSVSQSEGLCQQLVQAMTGCGTDEDSVYAVFQQMQSKADVLQLVNTFGVRYYQPCVWTSPVSYAIWQANDQAYGGGLSTWLGYDMSTSEIGKINAILTGKGIDYSF